MPPCFACLAWPAGNEDATRRVEHLVSALQTHQPERPSAFRMPGLYLADLSPTGHPACRILPLHNAEGVPAGCLYGTLFRRAAGSQRPLDRLSPEETRRICRTGGRALMTEYWGHYVLILKTGDTVSLLADPMSAIPCFYRRHGEIACVFSHLEACPDEFATDLTLDLASLRRLRVYDKIQTGRTAYCEIHELGGGQRLELIRPNASPETIWDPRPLASQPLHLSDQDAAEALHETVRDCVGSWASACGHIAMDLSGGLDSSIVTSCLAKVCNDKRLDIVHHHIRAADAPELVHAQATCAHLGLDLLALDIAPSRALPDPDAHPPSARPWRNFLGLGFDTILPDRLRSPETTFFTGQGGDHLFLMTRSPLGLTDCIRHGAYARLWTEWLNAARLSDTSLWKTFASNLPYLMGRTARSALETAIKGRLDRLDMPGGKSGAWLEGLPDWALRPGVRADQHIAAPVPDPRSPRPGKRSACDPPPHFTALDRALPEIAGLAIMSWRYQSGPSPHGLFVRPARSNPPSDKQGRSHTILCAATCRRLGKGCNRAVTGLPHGGWPSRSRRIGPPPRRSRHDRLCHVSRYVAALHAGSLDARCALTDGPTGPVLTGPVRALQFPR